MLAYRYDEDNRYDGTQECQLDPMESKKSGRDIWLLPASCTWKRPLQEKGGYYVVWNGTGWEYEPIPEPPKPPEPTIEELKVSKIRELKDLRDIEEVGKIEVNGHLFDYDRNARERINAAIVALGVTGGKVMWTLADNTDIEVSASDLQYVVAMVAQRSNALHIKYRLLKERVENAQTKDEVREIVWND